MSKGASSTFIAFKIICLAGDLSAADKRVAGTLIDHYNRKSGRCDPSIGRIARLLGIHERTVQRSINVLTGKGYVHLIRMGGLGNRNSYELHWSFLREKEAEWSHKFKNLRAELMATTSSVLRSARRSDTGQDANLTCLDNLNSITCDSNEVSAGASSYLRFELNGSRLSASHHVTPKASALRGC